MNSTDQPSDAVATGSSSAAFRALPAVDRLLAEERLAALTLPPALLVAVAREHLAAARARIAAGGAAPTTAALVDAIAHEATGLLRPGPRPVINATGVILHTNLGRAPLSDAALAALAAAGAGYSDLEFALASGERGSRHDHVEALLRRATGAEAGLAVNNNAAALLLTLSALCAGAEVVISRGQLVEIGGGFRIPDVLRQSGARLVEVGTTNRTRLADYEAASGPETAAYLRVHSSNFKQIGFVEQAELDALAGAAHARGLWLLDDIGSGALLPTERYGLAPEPTVQASLRAGADLVLFSGDKLLGGPQAGIIVGRAALVARLRRHPLARALRLDKTTIAALNATLLHYVRQEATTTIPVWRMISAAPAAIAARAHAWAMSLGERASVRDGWSMIGGGSLPGEALPTTLLAVRSPHPNAIARRLRLGEPAVVARVADNALLFDPRTVTSADDDVLLAAIAAALTA